MIKEAPLVSVIVRSMARPTLSGALETIAAQDHPPVEVIVVAAGALPHPGLPQRCGPHALRLLHNTKPLSRAAAANVGLAAARGEWITFLDDDDAYLPEHLSGLLAARREAPLAGVIHSWTRVVLADGTIKRNGQPFALMQIYERNITHLSAALVASAAIAHGVRFDEAFEILEDWDYFLQLAHITRFHFVSRQTFVWHADQGDSGAGLNRNHDDLKFAAALERIFAKWAARRDATIDRVQGLLQTAARAAQSGDSPAALAACDAALVTSPSDPWALNLRAMVERSEGQLTAARRSQELAAAVRPQDPDLVYNLALLCRDMNDLPAARRHCARAVALAPGEPRFGELASALAPH